MTHIRVLFDPSDHPRHWVRMNESGMQMTACGHLAEVSCKQYVKSKLAVRALVDLECDYCAEVLRRFLNNP